MLDDSEAILRKATTYVEKCENGNMSYSEMEEKVTELFVKFAELQEKYEGVDDISKMSDEQKKRAKRIFKEFDNLSLRAAGLRMQGWY